MPVAIKVASKKDILRTTAVPRWQATWDCEYLSFEKLEKDAVKIDDELIA